MIRRATSQLEVNTSTLAHVKRQVTADCHDGSSQASDLTRQAGSIEGPVLTSSQNVMELRDLRPTPPPDPTPSLDARDRWHFNNGAHDAKRRRRDSPGEGPEETVIGTCCQWPAGVGRHAGWG